MFKKNLEPTDFADSDCRVTTWVDYQPDFAMFIKAYRIWVCKVGNGHWFQRHEWQHQNKNSTELDDWIYNGYYPLKKWDDHLIPAPEDVL